LILDRYPTPFWELARIGASMVRGRRRSVGADSAAILRLVHPPPRAIGTEHIPDDGPFVVVANHYQRPGMWVGWGGMVVNAAVYRTRRAQGDIRWLMAAELLDYPLGPLVVRWQWIARVLTRFASTYGFGVVSSRDAGVVGGLSGLRVAARALAAGDPVGILPEGTESDALCEARPGVGAALAWLTRDNIKVVPAAITEPDGVLTVTFGEPFLLRAAGLPEAGGDKASRDRALREAVMGEIARLLPAEMHGHYAARV